MMVRWRRRQRGSVQFLTQYDDVSEMVDFSQSGTFRRHSSRGLALFEMVDANIMLAERPVKLAKFLVEFRAKISNFRTQG
jgi:hypothetical protein